MRAGTETVLARFIAVCGAAQPHCAFLFANRSTTCIKVLVHKGLAFGVWRLAFGWLLADCLKANSTGHHSTWHPNGVQSRAASGAGNRASLGATWIYQSSPYALVEMADRYRDEGQSKPATCLILNRRHALSIFFGCLLKANDHLISGFQSAFLRRPCPHHPAHFFKQPFTRYYDPLHTLAAIGSSGINESFAPGFRTT